jgi:hypothetical protein
MKLLAATLLLSLGLLTGCKDTIFESQPTEKVSTCDEHFVGKWRLLPVEKKKDDDELFVIVEPACRRWRYIEDGKDDTDTEKTVHVAFAKLGDLPLLTLKIDEKKPSTDSGTRWHTGYQYLRYEFVDKTIRLHPVDNAHVAHLIIDGGVLGRTERISREPGGKGGNSEELHNFVAGKPDEMARVAKLDGIFSSAEFYTLKPAVDAEIFKAASQPAKP